jgi:ligand-binding SRPBCC domain-containing protein
MKYAHRFRVKASLDQVVDFHRHAGSMAAITPFPIKAVIHAAPTVLTNDDEMDFTLWMGPLPIRWLARIEQSTPTSFVDRQLRGPHKEWVHRHTFSSLPDGTVEVLDEVEVKLANQWFWRVLGFTMWINLPILFAFRSWKTRQLLEQIPVSGKI